MATVKLFGGAAVTAMLVCDATVMPSVCGGLEILLWSIALTTSVAVWPATVGVPVKAEPLNVIPVGRVPMAW